MIDLSVVIPTFNRRQMLRRCLDGLSRQSYPADRFEVIVVDDGSTDGTAEMANRCAGRLSLKVVPQPNRGAASARNRGIDCAAGEYILFVDDDIVLEPDCLARHVSAQQERGGIVGIGRLTLRLAHGGDGFSRWFGRWWNAHYQRLEQSGTATWIDCFSGNLSAPRVELLQIGGFTTELHRGEDVELGYRLSRRGLSIVYLPQARGRQEYVKRSRDILADAYREGVSSVKLYRLHPPMLPRLPLAAFAETTWRAVLLRRLLLSINAPSWLPVLVGNLWRHGRWQDAWYELAHRYAFWMGVRAMVRDDDTWRRLTSGACILMYHGFATPGEKPSRYVVSAKCLAAQLSLLRWTRRNVINLDEYLRCRNEHRLPPARAVIITIDDGYLDNATVAAPMLRRHGFPATVFVVSRRIGRSNEWDSNTELAGRPLMRREDVLGLAREGFQIGSHTRTHSRLPTLPSERVRNEMGGSRVDLEQLIDGPVVTFSYPYGLFDSRVEAESQRAGFLGACTVRAGRNTLATPLFQLRRCEVRGNEHAMRLLLSLWLADPTWRRSNGSRGTTAIGSRII